ncbi:PREDICTED: FBD-associated F-box protein At2g26860-like [Erythranthe guttata]|uniref:FBD-associated F-box protein At2g26860-like n=1 Tax=Erythranthe guttata TaxID=4155 RepID=UPI00064DCA63|nr:PREDICTED: FBD-associated F-box protein At2g26860-like [Erythranthe guttata]|eukprot:XP_012836058.1 PREDICTED: FBD-associated F-box protein At2g26860-like [Erythranthe guttata]
MLDLDNCDRPFLYCIPDELLIRSCSTASKSLVCFKSLKALSLKSVGVSNGAIELLLDNCPLLEQLTVHRLVKISKLEICGSSLMLKDVEIYNCHSLESIKVSLPRLTALTLSHVKGLLLENVSMLVNVSVWSHDDNISMENLFDALSCCISQLETLKLDLFNPDCSRREKDELCTLPQMPKLKKLVVKYIARGDESLVRLAALLMLSPYLEEFVFKFNWFELPREDRGVKDAVTIPYHHLKVFKSFVAIMVVLMMLN